MNDQNNTIVNGSSRRTIQSNSTSTTNAHSRQGKKPMNQETLKMALAALAGAGVGSGAMWAGTQAASDGVVVDPVVTTPDEEQTAQPTVAQPEETPVTAADVDASAAQQAEQNADNAAHDKNARHGSGTNTGGGSSSDHHRHHPTPKPDPVDPTPKPDPVDPTPRPVPVRHTYEFDEVEEITDDEGNTMRFARGKMDEHEAVFRLDNDNRVLGAVVDLNDNGEFESNEFVDLRHENITAVVHPDPDPVVRVISVENDVDLNGHLVNVARVAVGDDHALLVDADQDNEVDYLVHDDNSDGKIDVSEVHDISERHMSMPTADDVENSGAELAHNDGLPDYSNDNDITNYYA